MRIIDKNTDYYDYLQDSGDTLVFDRRGSYILTKEKFCDKLLSSYHYKYKYGNTVRELHDEDYYRYVLLQCGSTFWLILLHATEISGGYLRPVDYELELLSAWKNYNKTREILRLDEVKFHYWTLINQKKRQTYHDFIISNVERMVDAINTNDCKFNNMNSDIVSRQNKLTLIREERTIPILIACGIADIIDPVDIFTALEEHFSLLKTESERIDPIGATNNDKIEMHGFDTKTSFRGKQKGTAV